MNGHPLVNKEMAKFQQEKMEALKLKKSQRGDKLKKAEEGIARMKRWNAELAMWEMEKQKLEAKERVKKIMDPIVKFGANATGFLKSMQIATEACNDIAKKFGSALNDINQNNPKPIDIHANRNYFVK